MVKKFFGTDGIRGTVNSETLNSEIALKLGLAAGKVFTRGNHKHRVVIGKDTRVSGYMLESALESGLTSSGMDVFLCGPIPTPAVAFLTQALRADLGVMITASHNTFEDNGFKLFGPDGYKLSDNKQLEIEDLMNSIKIKDLPKAGNIGIAKRVDDATSRYLEFSKATFPNMMRLDHLKIVIDCANGAAYKVAPKVFWELGADIIVIGDQPNGRNINLNCGTTNTETIREKVVNEKADLGISFDGDADRLVIIDENGHEVNGDHLLAMIAKNLKDKNMLQSNTIVGTIMSNKGLEEYLSEIGINLIRSKVGDRHVVEEMRKQGVTLGGEPSGHIIINNFCTTGDAIIASLQVLASICEEKKSISELTNLFPLYHQAHNSIQCNSSDSLDDSLINKLIEEKKDKLGKKGRIIIRKSGTEPIVRVMIESEDSDLNFDILEEISFRIKEHFSKYN
jgi:phosphoglucosamine mutase|tara:strand:- start:1283 stop:2638 length:1356 start_codon:yes stop_codon:yes gene_type:complete